MTEILLNNELKGIEMYFDGKPGKEILSGIKEAGFRWNGKKLCWYAKQSPERLAKAQKYGIMTDSEIQVPEATRVLKNNIKISLWNLTRWEGLEVNNKLSTKEIASEIRKYIKNIFPFCKFSVTSTYSSIDFAIKSSPFEREGVHLKAIQDYCTSLIKAYNYCTCDDPYGDYGSSYNFYGARCVIDYNYMQTEQTEQIKEAMKEFDIKQNEELLEEEVREEQKYQEYLKEQEVKENQYKLREAKRKKGIDFVNNDVEVIELEEGEQYFILNSDFANLNKNNTIEEYKEEVQGGNYREENIRITREIHFKSQEALNYYSNLLLSDFSFLEGTGGSSSVVAIYFNNKIQFVVDTQGYNYARYVGLVNNATIQRIIE